MWVKILNVKEMNYVVYRATTLFTQKEKGMPVTVLVWYADKHKISVHIEGENPHVISLVRIKECRSHVGGMLYHSHVLCSLAVIEEQGAVETNVDHSAMWSIDPQCALQLIIHLVARDIHIPKGKNTNDAESPTTFSIFSVLPMSLTDIRGNGQNERRAMGFCTRYDGYIATSYVQATEDGTKWESVDETRIASRDACSQVIDVYSGIRMTHGNSPLVTIHAKDTSGMIKGKYIRTETVRDLLLEMPDDVFSSVCSGNPFCCVENTLSDSQDNRLTLCLASKPNDDHIGLRLKLHRFVKAKISRSLNALIEAVTNGH